MAPNENPWQAANEWRLRQQTQWLAAQPDETLFTGLWHDHYVVVTKEGHFLRLWMMEQAAPRTDWVQSALDLRDPLRLVLTYTQAMMLSLAWQPAPARVYVSGLGGGCLATVLHHYLCGTHLDCVEIAPPVVEAARRFFGFCPDERMALAVDDARSYLEKRPAASYDILFLDLFTDAGLTPAHLSDDGFYQLCFERLTRDGLLTVNLGSQSPAYRASLQSLVSRFEHLYICPGRGSTHILFATNGRPFSRQAVHAQQERHAFRFPFVEWVDRFRPRGSHVRQPAGDP